MHFRLGNAASWVSSSSLAMTNGHRSLEYCNVFDIVVRLEGDENGDMETRIISHETKRRHKFQTSSPILRVKFGPVSLCTVRQTKSKQEADKKTLPLTSPSGLIQIRKSHNRGHMHIKSQKGFHSQNWSGQLRTSMPQPNAASPPLILFLSFFPCRKLPSRFALFLF